jgi:hypothetical protein
MMVTREDAMEKRGRKTIAAIIIFFFLLGWGSAWGQEVQKTPTPPPVPEEVAGEKLPEKPGEQPIGNVPGVSAPDLYGTLGLGPVAGVLAPYGNPVAYDLLQRGWRSHRLGNIVIYPYFAIDGLYRSNIFLTSNDKKSAFITVLTPGLRAELPIAGRHRLSVGYLGSGFIYTSYTNQSHYDQNVNVDMALNFKGGTTLRVGNTFRAATEEINSDFGQRRSYVQNTPYLTFADRWKFQADYQFNTLIFNQTVNQVNNYNQHNVGATLYYRFLPKTSALIEYILTYTQYPSFSVDNNYSNSPLVGLSWEPTAKLSGTVKFGYTFTQYETGLPDRNNSPQDWIMSVQLLYRYSRLTNLTLTVQRSFQQDVDFRNQGYQSTGLWVSLNHTWNYFKVYSYATFFYINNDYLNETVDFQTGNLVRRLDNVIGMGVGFSRPINRWLRARVDYIYTNRSSNFFGYSYNDNRVLFGLVTSF